MSGLSGPDRDSIARAVVLRIGLAVLLLASGWSLVNAWVDWRMAPLLERLDALALVCSPPTSLP